MGSMCSTVEQQEKFEARVDEAAEKAQDFEEAVQDKVEDAVEQAKDAVQAGAEKAEEAYEQAKDAVQAGAEEAAEAVADATAKAGEQAEVVREAAEEATADVREQIGEALADVKEGAATAADAAADVMTAAVAAVTDTMVVEFEVSKGTAKSVHFKTQAPGFSCARAGGGCSCLSAPKQKVVVCKVDKKSEAERLGVQRGWAVKAVSGTGVTGLDEANKLLSEGASKLSQA